MIRVVMIRVWVARLFCFVDFVIKLQIKIIYFMTKLLYTRLKK